MNTIRRPAGCLGLVASFLMFVPGPTRAQGPYVPGQALVKPRPNPAGQASRSAVLPAPGVRVRRILGDSGWQLVDLPAGLAVPEGVAWLRRQPAVAAAEPNHRYGLHATPNDPLAPRLWGLEQIQAPAAWDLTPGSSNVIVAVLDTGVDSSHPDLAPNLWRNPGETPGNGIDDDLNGFVDDVQGVDFTDGDSDPADDAGHGTHVAGTIAAAGDNGLGIVGVSWRARILAVRMLSADGAADAAGIVSAFDYVHALRRRGENVRILNASWGGGFPSQAIAEAIGRVVESGVLVVVSAGNDGQDNDRLPTFPACLDSPGLVAVAASDSDDEPAGFSNFGRRTVHLAAPGRGVLSTFHGGPLYAQLSGTSMSAPHVSGAAALLLARQPDLTVPQLRALLLNSADARTPWAGRLRTGARLNARRALDLLQTANPLPTNTPPPAVEALRLTLVSRSPDGPPAREASHDPSLSADGRYVAFVSAATNLVTGDTNGVDDIFLRDLQTGDNVRVSQSPSGLGANGPSHSPVLSGDGLFVAFVSDADNLVSGDGNGASDVFVWDRSTRQTTLASVRSAGGWANGASDSPALSPDGRYVAFASDASNMTTSDRNAARDVFLRDRTAGLTILISRALGGSSGSGISDAPSMSADGRFVAFHSGAFDLVAGDLNGAYDVFVRDRQAGQTTRVSVSSAGQAGDADSGFPLIAADGRWVAFESLASNLTGTPPPAGFQIYLHDRQGPTTQPLGPDPDSAPPEGTHYLESISADGRFVGFSTDSTSLPRGASIATIRPFLFDRISGSFLALAWSDAGYEGNDNTFGCTLSPDARFVAFSSWAFNLVPGDGNGTLDVFVLDRAAQPADLKLRKEAESRWIGEGLAGPGIPQRVQLFDGPATHGAVELQLVNTGAAPAAFVLGAAPPPAGWTWTCLDGWPSGNSISASLTNAGWTCPPLNPGATQRLRLELNGPATADRPKAEILVTVRPAQATNLVDAAQVVAERTAPPPGFALASRAEDGSPSARNAELPAADAEGRRVAWSSEADHLAPHDTNLQSDVFLLDRDSRRVSVLSLSASGELGDGDSRYPSLSLDGRRVAFQSRAANLVTGDTNGVEDIFVKDTLTGEIQRANVGPGRIQANRGAESARLSGDGRWVLYQSLADNLVPGTTNRAMNLFLHDRIAETTECVSRVPGGPLADADSGPGVLTASGAHIVFTSFASNLGPMDANGFADVYLLDRARGSLELISATPEGRSGNAPSGAASVSDDGRFVVFSSAATDLVAASSSPAAGTFLLDRQSRRLAPIESLVTNLPPGHQILGAELSPDGRWLALSLAPDPDSSPRPANLASQIYLFDRDHGDLLPVSLDAEGLPGEADSSQVSFSGGGRHLVFASASRRLLGEHSAGAQQVFLHDRAILQPDLWVRRDAVAPWRGAYELATLQSTELPVAPGTLHTFYLRVRNGAEFADRVRVRAPAGQPPDWPIQFFDDSGGQEITAAVAGDGWLTPELAPEALLDLRGTLMLTANPASDFPCPITATSAADPRAADQATLWFRPDLDRDGMPESWEQERFGSSGIATASTDQDGDGALDVAEYAAATDPRNPGSTLVLTGIRRAPAEGIELSWHSVPGREYWIERCPRLGEPFVTAAGPLPASPPENRHVIPAPPTGAAGFYRVATLLP